jgi:hypothetical protein
MLIQNIENQSSGDVGFCRLFLLRLLFDLFLFVSFPPPFFFTLFASLLLLINTALVNGMDVSMMKNGIVNVEYSANVVCSSKILLA